MTNEQIDTWLAALRSGEFKQTQNALARDANGYETGNLDKADSFCCIGVAAKVMNVPELTGEFEDTKKVSVALKIKMGSAALIGSRLVRMNDCEGDSFKQIASYIEAHRQELLDGETCEGSGNGPDAEGNQTADVGEDAGNQQGLQQ